MSPEEVDEIKDRYESDALALTADLVQCRTALTQVLYNDLCADLFDSFNFFVNIDRLYPFLIFINFMESVIECNASFFAHVASSLYATHTQLYFDCD